MSWNYRVVNYQGYVGIVEAFYDKNGDVRACSANPLIISEDIDSLIWSLEKMLDSIKTKPIIEEENLPGFKNDII